MEGGKCVLAHQDKENDIEAAGRHRRQSHSLKKVQGNLFNIKDERITNMSRQILTSAKAVIIQDGKLLAIKLRDGI